MTQSLSNILIHIIFTTKERQRLIDENIELDLYAYITSIIAAHGSYMHKIGGIDDHIHLLVTLPRTISASSFLAEIKKNSSRWIKAKGKKYQNFSWQKGFGIFSVSFSQREAVITYIANQKAHHKNFSFQDEYRKFLQLHNVTYDEKYVWD